MTRACTRTTHKNDKHIVSSENVLQRPAKDAKEPRAGCLRPCVKLAQAHMETQVSQAKAVGKALGETPIVAADLAEAHLALRTLVAKGRQRMVATLARSA